MKTPSYWINIFIRFHHSDSEYKRHISNLFKEYENSNDMWNLVCYLQTFSIENFKIIKMIELDFVPIYLENIKQNYKLTDENMDVKKDRQIFWSF